MSEVTHEEAIERASRGIIGALDPRARLLAALGFVVVLIVLKSLAALFCTLLVAFALIWLAGASFHATVNRLRHVEGFMALLLLMLPFTVAGHPRLALGPLVATDEGLLLAVRLFMRVNAAVLAVFALLGALEPVRLGQALARLGLPLTLAHLFLFAARYVDVFRTETRRLREAMRARAFAARSNWRTWRALGTLAGMVLVRAIERADRVHEAMRCRGFTGRFPLARGDAFTRADLLFGAGLALVMLALAAADRLL